MQACKLKPCTQPGCHDANDTGVPIAAPQQHHAVFQPLRFLFQQFLRSEKILAGDAGTEFFFRIFIQTCFFTEATEIVHFSYGYFCKGSETN